MKSKLSFANKNTHNTMGKANTTSAQIATVTLKVLHKKCTNFKMDFIIDY